MTDAELRDETLWEAMIEMSEGFASIVVTHEDDCDQMALEMNDLVEVNEELADAAQQVFDSAEVRKAYLDKYKGRIVQAAERMESGFQKCADHEGVQKVRKRLE